MRAELDQISDSSVVVRFTVRDTGIGFSKAVGQRLFEPFSQADGSVTRKYGGTGLGLAISRRLAELMDGTISAESVTGQGSTLSFTARFERAIQVPVAAPANLTNLRALVVDDSGSNQDSIQSYLRAWGITTDGVASGDAALAALHQATSAGAPYHLVITDLAMPEMDGFAMARAVQRDTRVSRSRCCKRRSRAPTWPLSSARPTGCAAVVPTWVLRPWPRAAPNWRRLAARERAAAPARDWGPSRPS